ncbi:MAG: hypothetical protein K8T25_22945, partial [Planctomycetia bacterium]|nr:hypothetical protein [Planctomycetia bacterium]
PRRKSPQGQESLFRRPRNQTAGPAPRRLDRMIWDVERVPDDVELNVYRQIRQSNLHEIWINV